MNTLEALRKTSEAVAEASNIKEAMAVMVSRITNDIGADACSIFIYDEEADDFVLISTTRNLNILPGQWRVKRGQGLLSRVAEKGELINLEDAQAQPDNVELHLEAGIQQAFNGYLGAPIIHQGQALGVLTAQKIAKEKFNEEAVSFLVTIAAQMAATVANTLGTGKLFASIHSHGKRQSFWLSGTPGSAGVAIGKAMVVYPSADFTAIPDDRESEDIEGDIEAFMESVQAVTLSIEQMGRALEGSISNEDQVLFSAYVQILESNSFKGAVLDRIKNGQWVQSALRVVVNQNAKNFDAMSDDYLKERAADIRDIGRRVLAHLQRKDQTVKSYPPNTILVGTEITASNLAEIPKDRLAGVISASGSPNAHVAILARALGVPAAMGVKHLPLSSINDKELILDGYTGRVYVEPNAALKKSYEQLAEEEREMQASLKELAALSSETKDECHIALRANVGLVADLDPAVEVNAEGIGLYRTEVPFMILERFPSEEEQRVLYRQGMQAFVDHPVIMRVLDAGGDKILPYFHVEESNPYLGWRGIRMLLDHPEIFLIQIRAMLRASFGLDNLHIMLPMITKLSEVKEARLLIQRAFNEVCEEGLEIDMPKIGVMIEVPAAVFQLERILQYVDFVSVGSNDLTQYLLAVDRNNSRVDGLYNPFHPAVVHALARIAEIARAANKPLSLCGELASDPMATILLIGMGFDSLSMNAMAIPRIKWVIRGFSKEECEKIVQKVLKMDRSKSIRKILQEKLIDAGFGGLIRAGKH